VHRLDRETSGLMLFAKSEPVKMKLQEFWNETVIERTYIAVVEGMVEQQEGTISSYLSEDKVFKMHSSQAPGDGQKAVTHFSVLKKNEVAGDKKYDATTNPMKRLGLHATKITFIHPVTDEKMNFETKIPRAFMRLF
jgi:23S rRNA pseudouridine1911/1915/1917 synthase